MNEQDFVSMIDEHIAAIMKHPRMYGKDPEIESAVFALLILRAKTQGEESGYVTTHRVAVCKQLKISSGMSFADQLSEARFLDAVEKFIVLNTIKQPVAE